MFLRLSCAEIKRNSVNTIYFWIIYEENVKSGIQKDACNDAVVITNIKPNKYSDNIYYIKASAQKKRNLHEEIPRKGRKEPNKKAKRNNKNTKQIIVKNKKWCLWDKVYIPEIEKFGYISGFTGNWVYVQDIQGNYLQITSKYKQISTEKIRLLCRNNNWITDSSSTFAYAQKWRTSR